MTPETQLPATRHFARSVAFQVLYRMDGPKGEHDGAEAFDLNEHFEHFEVPEKIREIAGALVHGTVAERSAIDAKIESASENWKLSRMAAVDRCLLRLAVFELCFFRQGAEQVPTPPKVVIDEAIELAKAFGSENSAGFINGILDALA